MHPDIRSEAACSGGRRAGDARRPRVPAALSAAHPGRALSPAMYTREPGPHRLEAQDAALSRRRSGVRIPLGLLSLPLRGRGAKNGRAGDDRATARLDATRAAREVTHVALYPG